MPTKAALEKQIAKLNTELEAVKAAAKKDAEALQAIRTIARLSE